MAALEQLTWVAVAIILVWIALFLTSMYTPTAAIARRLQAQAAGGQLPPQTVLRHDVAALLRSTKPILWVYLPERINELNQTGNAHGMWFTNALALWTHCHDSFHVCFFDQWSLFQLLPEWTIDLRGMATTLQNKVLQLARMKLLYIYGGLMCPISFVCMRDLLPLWTAATQDQHVCVAETHAYVRTPLAEGSGSNASSCEQFEWVDGTGGSRGSPDAESVLRDDRDPAKTDDMFPPAPRGGTFLPDLQMIGAPCKEHAAIRAICKELEAELGDDWYTLSDDLDGTIGHWIQQRMHAANSTAAFAVRALDPVMIGARDTRGKPVLVDTCLSPGFAATYKRAYGLWVPARELEQQGTHPWFLRLRPSEVPFSHTLIADCTVKALADSDEDLVARMDEFAAVDDGLSRWTQLMHSA